MRETVLVNNKVHIMLHENALSLKFKLNFPSYFFLILIQLRFYSINKLSFALCGKNETLICKQMNFKLDFITRTSQFWWFLQSYEIILLLMEFSFTNVWILLFLITNWEVIRWQSLLFTRKKACGGLTWYQINT